VDVVDEVAIKASATKPDGVQSAECSRVACHKAEGKDVLGETCAATYHRITTHAAELVHQHTSTQNGVIVDDYLACQLGAVTDNAAVSHNGIVCNMRSLHEQIVVAHDCASLCSRASIDGHVLAYLVIVAYLCRTLFATELEVLRNGTDDSTWEEDVSIANASAIKHSHTVHQRIVVANNHSLVNIAEGTYLAVLTNDGFGMYVC